MHLHFNFLQFDLSSLSGCNIVLNGSQDLLPSGAQVLIIIIISAFKERCVVSPCIRLACGKFELILVS